MSKKDVSNEVTFNAKVALTQFEKRRAAHKGKEKNNASLYAGSPMYFYCRHCSVSTDTLPESYTTTPKTICDECQELQDHGIVGIV